MAQTLRENLALIVSIAIIVGGIAWYIAGSNSFFEPEEKVFLGRVQAIAASAGVITVQTEDMDMVDVAITSDTALRNKNNEAIALDAVKRGFMLEVKGAPQNGAVQASAVAILEEPNIIVFEPATGTEVAKQFTVKGIARTFENNVLARVKDANTDAIYFRNFTTADAPDIGQYGGYAFQVALRAPNLKEHDMVVLEVFEESAEDGSEINKVVVPLMFMPNAGAGAGQETQKVKVYFGNNKLDPEITCEKTFPVEREVRKTTAIGSAALRELIKGPTAAEQEQGYFTSINPATALKMLRIKNGVAYPDFSAKLNENVAGSCQVGFIRAQIQDTLKQFYTVSSVVISINGETEEILQP